MIYHKNGLVYNETYLIFKTDCTLQIEMNAVVRQQDPSLNIHIFSDEKNQNILQRYFLKMAVILI